jgi:hypothetical protein
MTPTQLNHLRLIDAHLERLLDIASKRTPGEWEVDQAVTWDQSRGINPQIVQRNAYLTADDAAFIAAAAGNAEAGWKATRAAIAAIASYSILDENLDTMVNDILAAFPNI